MDYIFSGPTLEKNKINKILPEAKLLPPIKSSDLINILRNSNEKDYPRRILIVDGFFHGKLSVRHKEILYALNQGIEVYGSSSIGALRAAECSKYGMIGVGRIFDFFSSKFATSDDEVAVTYTSNEPYEELSLPLINLRFAINDIFKKKIIDKNQKEKLLRLIKKIHFSDRTFNYLQEIKFIKEFVPVIKSFYINWKERDAIEALKLMKSKNNHKSDIKEWNLNHGSFFLNYYSDTYVNYSSDIQEQNLIKGSNLPNKLNSSNYERLQYNSFNRIITLKYAQSLGINPNDEDVFEFQKFIKESGKVSFKNKFTYIARSSDPKIKYKFAKEELTILLLHSFVKGSLGDIGLTLPLQDYLSSKSLVESLLKNKNFFSNLNKGLSSFKEIEKLNSLKYQDINLQGRITK